MIDRTHDLYLPDRRARRLTAPRQAGRKEEPEAPEVRQQRCQERLAQSAYRKAVAAEARAAALESQVHGLKAQVAVLEQRVVGLVWSKEH